VAGLGHGKGKRSFHSGNSIPSFSMIFLRPSLFHNRTVGDQAKITFFWNHATCGELSPQGVALFPESEMLSHAIKRGLRIE
jgi:hypothetical protein